MHFGRALHSVPVDCLGCGCAVTRGCKAMDQKPVRLFSLPDRVLQVAFEREVRGIGQACDRAGI